TSLGLYRYVYKCRIVRNGQTIAEGVGTCSTLESKYIDRPRDCENTVCKMAQKRAFVAATLHAFGLSDRFTQDIEDNPEVFGGHSDDYIFDAQAAPVPSNPPPEPRAQPQPKPEPQRQGAAAKPKIYSGTSDEEKLVASVLRKNKVPEEFW